jgi:hypothetical protein
MFARPRQCDQAQLQLHLTANALASHCVPAREVHSGGGRRCRLMRNPSVVAPPVVIMRFHKRWKCPPSRQARHHIYLKPTLRPRRPGARRPRRSPRPLISSAHLNIGSQRMSRQNHSTCPTWFREGIPLVFFWSSGTYKSGSPTRPAMPCWKSTSAASWHKPHLMRSKGSRNTSMGCAAVNVERVEMQWTGSRWAPARSESFSFTLLPTTAREIEKGAERRALNDRTRQQYYSSHYVAILNKYQW